MGERNRKRAHQWNATRNKSIGFKHARWCRVCGIHAYRPKTGFVATRYHDEDEWETVPNGDLPACVMPNGEDLTQCRFCSHARPLDHNGHCSNRRCRRISRLIDRVGVTERLIALIVHAKLLDECSNHHSVPCGSCTSCKIQLLIRGIKSDEEGCSTEDG